MSTGWLDDNGSRYFLNNDGTMKTGWLQQMNQYYYLDEASGKMATGWKRLDGNGISFRIQVLCLPDGWIRMERSIS